MSPILWLSPGLVIGVLLCTAYNRKLDAQEHLSTKPDTLLASSQNLGGLDRARRATVSIEVSGVSGRSSGSGFLVSPNGVVATAAHVIRGASQGQVRLASGETYDVLGVLDFDERLDLALLAIAGFGLPVADLGNADDLAVGQRIIAIGSPLGLEATVTDGIVSAVRLSDGVRRLQISTPVAPGSSGGPFLTENGMVVGLVQSGIRGGGAENLNFGLPINYVRGKLTFATGKTPTPLGEVNYGALATTSPGLSRADGGLAGSVQRLNDQLHLDFVVLDGAQIASEEKGKGQLRIKNVVWYALSQDPNGVFSIERASSSTYRSQGLFTGQDFATENLRTVYVIGQVNRFSSTYERISRAPDWPSTRSEFVVSGSQYSLQVNGGAPKTGNAPPGVFPPYLIPAVTAALPDPLPAKVSFWVLDPESDRVQEVSLEVVGTGSQKVPVAVRDQKCLDRTPTGLVDVEVTKLRRRLGLTDETFAVLSRQPHLLIDNGVKCVRARSLAPPNKAQAPPPQDVRPM